MWCRIFFLLSLLFSGISLSAEVHLCLSLPIGRDWDHLSHCLESVEPWVDCISFCDAETDVSADLGLKAAEYFLDNTGIAGSIDCFEGGILDFSDRWKSVLLLLEERGFALEDTYVLFLEPDCLLKPSQNFDVKGLKEDLYAVLEQSKTRSSYQYLPCLVKASKMERFWDILSKGQFSRDIPSFAKLRNILIERQPGSGLESDLEILEASYRKDPQNSRIQFLLAETCQSLGFLEKAISYYEARIANQERGEEVWFSKYKIAQCYQELGNWEKAFFGYLEALEEDPSRAESLLPIATHYREIGKNQIGYLFAKHGSRFPFQIDKNLFPFLYQYPWDQELSISSYYTPFKEEGFDACNHLVLCRQAPEFLRDQTYRNLLFYVQRLKNLRCRSIPLDLSQIDKSTQEIYHPMNPSLMRTKEGYQVICRAVNYTQTGAKHFQTSDPKGIYRSLNFLLSFDRDFRLLSQQQIFEELPRERTPRFLLEGIEDCRIFLYQEKPWFTCTSFDSNPTGNPQIALCQIDSLSQEEADVGFFLPLLGPDPNRCEKNWLPFVHGGEVQAIYSYDPFVIYKPNLHTGECLEVVRYQPLHNFSRFRGSAAPIPFEKGYLMMVHEVVFMPEWERCYLHRFLYLDADFHIQALSKPFVFDHCGVEFCCGMAYSHSGKDLIMAIGIEDKKALLGSVDLETVRSLLEPLPEISPSLVEME